jgi:hypothetical protein
MVAQRRRIDLCKQPYGRLHDAGSATEERTILNHVLRSTCNRRLESGCEQRLEPR